ncbi:hypothetical protein AMTRI_Chr11g95500 [Amborella trichopoda]
MTRKSLIQREMKRQKLEHNFYILVSTRRPIVNYRDFGLYIHVLREMVRTCLLPGATRLSW